MIKSTSILALLLFLTSCCFGQTIKLFDTRMLSEQLSQCDLISKYLNKVNHYEYYVLDTNYYGITAEGYCLNISGNYNFAVRNDSLCQIYFTAYFPRSSTSLKSISIKVDSLIEGYIKQFGKPVALIDNRKDSANPDIISGYDLLNVAWLLNNDKFKIELSFSDSNKEDRSIYVLRIHRFRECYADKKFSSWWKSR